MIRTFDMFFGNGVHVGMKLFFAILAALSLTMLPVVTWGWKRWVASKKRFTLTGSLSFTALLIDSISALLAVTTEITVDAGGSPLLETIVRWGSLLAFGGLFISLSAVWRRNPIRWHALAAAIGVLAYWLCASVWVD
jgi:hypothetical protein